MAIDAVFDATRAVEARALLLGVRAAAVREHLPHGAAGLLDVADRRRDLRDGRGQVICFWRGVAKAVAPRVRRGASG